MATKYYGIKDNWTDDDLANVIEVASEDGSVSSVKVNGVEYGGGGSSDFSAANVIFINNTGDEAEIYIAYVNQNPAGYYIDNPYYASTGTNDAIITPLYMGENNVMLIGYSIEVSGAAIVSGNNITITGDCTITIS